MEGNNLKSYENLCKIFETRIKLDKEKNIETPPDVIINYEKYSKKIDTIYNSQFEKEIKPLITKEVTIEKEEERLNKLIALLKDRIDKRRALEDRFYETTGSYIKNLQLIVSEDELQDKEKRRDTISRYLDTKDEINTVSTSIEELKEKLREEVQKQDEYQKKNKIMEDELYSSFKDIIDKEEYLKNINEEDIDTTLEEIKDTVNDNKETLDITKDSVSSLLNNGEDNDYISYVEDAERNYFLWKNREILLKIYKEVITFEDNYNELYDKRDKIAKLLRLRKNIKDNLTIDIIDNVTSFENVVKEQQDILKNEKEVLENVSNYTNRINFKEERLEELNEANNDVEILTILREYNLIETYDNIDNIDDIDTADIETYDNLEDLKEEDTSAPPAKEEETISKEINPYTIKSVEDYPRTLNLGLAKLKGESVREKVNKRLNPPKKEVKPKVEVPEVPSMSIDIPTTEDKTEEKSSNIPVWNDIKEDTETLNKSSSINNSKEEIKEKVPTWTAPKNDVKNDIPAWDIPKKSEPKLDVPTWDIPKKEEDTLPKWSMPDINSNNNNNTAIWNETTTEGNIDKDFWGPVNNNDFNNSFPDLNIKPINNFNSNKDNFGFPDINNNN